VVVAAAASGLGGVVVLAAALVDDPIGLVAGVDPGRLLAGGLDAAWALLPRPALAVLGGLLLAGCYLAGRSWTPVPAETGAPARLVVRRGSTGRRRERRSRSSCSPTRYGCAAFWRGTGAGASPL
jgi:hypothetical protein